MKLPAIVRTLYNLPWSGTSLDVETYQRLSLRGFILSLVVLLVAVVVGAPFMLFLKGNIVSFIVMVVVGAAVVAGSLWLLYQLIKLNVLRMRNLGFNRAGFIVLTYVVTFVAASIASGVQDAAMEDGHPMVAHIAGLFLIPGAVLTGLLFFRSKPLWPVAVPAARPLGTDIRGEKIGLFLLQTWIWYTVLSTPLNIIFP